MVRRISTSRSLFVLAIAMFVALVGGNVACSGSAGEPPVVEVSLYGWAPGGGDNGFVQSLQEYPGAHVVDVKLTQPRDQRIKSKPQATEIDAGEAKLPKLSFGDNLRLDFDLIDPTGIRVASGATPLFDLGPESDDVKLRVMVMPTQDYAPVGARYSVTSGSGWEYQPTRFDERASGNKYIGRIGHQAVHTSRGNVLIVGGGQEAPGRSLEALPKLETALGDVQLFEPKTGYVTDLGFDEEAQSVRPNGADRLDVARAYHTLTPIGDDQFIAIGGFTKTSDGKTKATKSIELVNLRGEPGTRVQKLIGASGEPMSLNVARGFHTATYRREHNHIVVIGGVGAGGPNDVIQSIEIVDLENRQVVEAGKLQTPRAEHSAVLMGDRAASIWVLGGRNQQVGALPTTELVSLVDAQTTAATGKPNMNVARFDMGAVRVRGKLVVVCGGFTSVDGSGSATKSCQIGHMDRDQWASNWKMRRARGGLDMVEMTQSNDIALIGGRDADGELVRESSLLEFQGGAADPPYKTKPRAGTMWKKRFHPSVTRLMNGMILLTGGQGKVQGKTAPRPDLEYYNPGDIVRSKPEGESSTEN